MTNEVQSNEYTVKTQMSQGILYPVHTLLWLTTSKFKMISQAFYRYSDPNSWTICYRGLLAKQFATITS